MIGMQKTIFTFQYWTLFLIACFIPFQIHASEVRHIRVGYVLFESYQELAPDGSRSGYGYEYLEHIADYTGWQYEYITCTWNQCLQMLEKGEIDLLTYVNKNENRSHLFNFPTRPMGECYGTLSIKKNNNDYHLNEIEKFHNLRIGMNEGNIFNEYFAEYCKKHHIVIASTTM